MARNSKKADEPEPQEVVEETHDDTESGEADVAVYSQVATTDVPEFEPDDTDSDSESTEEPTYETDDDTRQAAAWDPDVHDIWGMVLVVQGGQKSNGRDAKVRFEIDSGVAPDLWPLIGQVLVTVKFKNKAYGEAVVKLVNGKPDSDGVARAQLDLYFVGGSFKDAGRLWGLIGESGNIELAVSRPTVDLTAKA